MGDPQNDGVVWSVDNTAGGNATVGQISRSGLYVAPVRGGIHTIVATSLVDPTKSGSAAIAVGAVMTDPTGDQTITGAYRLSLSDPASELLVRGKEQDGPGEAALNQIFFNNYFGLSPQRRTTLLGESAANGYLVGTASEAQDTGNGALIGDYSVVLSENSNTTPGNGSVVFAYEGDVTSNLAGSKILDAATSFSSGMDIEGDGTITTVSSFNEQGLAKNGTTVVHNNFGFSALKHAGIGDNLNDAFYAAAQCVGPPDSAIYIAGAKNNLGPQGTSVGSLVVTKPHTPLSAFDTGTTGTIAWDSNFIYICVAPNTWRRAPISSW
jgi:hypothetical protein